MWEVDRSGTARYVSEVHGGARPRLWETIWVKLIIAAILILIVVIGRLGPPPRLCRPGEVSRPWSRCRVHHEPLRDSVFRRVGGDAAVH